MISQERLRELLCYDPETGALCWIKPTSNVVKPSQIIRPNSHGYVTVRLDGGLYRAHHLAWFYMTGAWPKGDVDHKNLDRSDNRWTNLREASVAQNRANTGCRSHNKSGLKGVQKAHGANRWNARITVDSKTRYLGSFKTPLEAHAAYVKAAREAFGEYARAA